jgi:hypothetical protein
MRNRVRWIFVTTRLQRDDWRWQQLDETGNVVKRSRVAFPFFLQCVADATKHGYVAEAQTAGATAKRSQQAGRPVRAGSNRKHVQKRR